MLFFKKNWFKISILIIIAISALLSLYIQFSVDSTKTTERFVATSSTQEFNIESLREELKAEIEKRIEANSDQHLNSDVSTQMIPDSPPILSRKLLKEIESRIVIVKCYGSSGITHGSGTAQLVNNNEKIIVTNFHVTNGAGSDATCTIQFPLAPDYTTSSSVVYQTQRGKFSPYFPKVDIALLHVTNIGGINPDLFTPFPLPGCGTSQSEIGTRIAVLGYPSFGKDTLTVTEGTISGILPTEYGPKYKTSAKMDHGVSGGLAVDTERSCVIGIPTWGEYSSSFLQDYGVGEILGQIQSWESIKNYGEIF